MPSIGLVGVGRMGKALAARMAKEHAVCIYDRDPAQLDTVAAELSLDKADSIEKMAQMGTVVLAVPDREVISCIKCFNQMPYRLTVVNIATNVNRHIIREIAASHVTCISAKIVGHADEMLLGQKPLIIVDDRPAELVELVCELFAPAGDVLVGRADIVSRINTIAAEAVLSAAVNIEEKLRQQKLNDPAIVRASIRQVAVGTLKAYADGNLGPFAREIVQAVQAKMKVKK
jgi:hypothetical protein